MNRKKSDSRDNDHHENNEHEQHDGGDNDHREDNVSIGEIPSSLNESNLDGTGVDEDEIEGSGNLSDATENRVEK